MKRGPLILLVAGNLVVLVARAQNDGEAVLEHKIHARFISFAGADR